MTDFSHVDLRGSRFDRVDLSGAQLSVVDLSGAQLSTVDLSNTRFRGVDLTGVVRGVELVNADIYGMSPWTRSGHSSAGW